MVQAIRLHGGPMHGQLVGVQDGRHHFHIIAPLLPEPRVTAPAEYPEDSEIKKREGTYSRVHNSSEDFEWDGWTSHD